jgi:Holliday junction resolvase RusA-like endonuclease
MHESMYNCEKVALCDPLDAPYRPGASYRANGKSDGISVLRENRFSLEIKFFIPGPLPGLNEIIAASKKRIPWLSKGKKQVYEYSKMKSEWTDRVATHFLEQYKRPERPFQNPVEISFLFIEPNRKRDPDNVFAGMKFILDSLVKVGVLQDDSQKYVKSISCSIGPSDKNKPCVFVVIKEV